MLNISVTNLAQLSIKPIPKVFTRPLRFYVGSNASKVVKLILLGECISRCQKLQNSGTYDPSPASPNVVTELVAVIAGEFFNDGVYRLIGQPPSFQLYARHMSIESSFAKH